MLPLQYLRKEAKHNYSILGNYSVAILKASETYDELALGLQDICEETQDLEVLTIQGNVDTINFFGWRLEIFGHHLWN